MKVAIVGAAGAIGQSTAAELSKRGTQLRLVGRSLEKLDSLPGSNVERVSADVSTPEGCARAVEGCDAAVYTLGLPYTKRDFARYPGMMRTFLDACRAAGVRKAILITNVYPYGLPQTARVSESHPRQPASVKGEFRKLQEDVLLAAHERSGLQTLSLRLPNFYGPAAKLSLVDGLFKAAVRGKRGDLFGPVDLPQELVFTPDVGPVVGDLLARDDVFGEAYNFAGPGTITWRQFAAAVYGVAGLPPKVRVAGPGMIKALGVVWGLMRELTEMTYLQTHPVLLDDSKLQRVLGTVRKTPYAEGIRQTMAAYAAEAAQASSRSAQPVPASLGQWER